MNKEVNVEATAVETALKAMQQLDGSQLAHVLTVGGAVIAEAQESKSFQAAAVSDDLKTVTIFTTQIRDTTPEEVERLKQLNQQNQITAEAQEKATSNVVALPTAKEANNG